MDNDMENLEKVTNAKSLMEDKAKHMGLYLEDWQPLIAAEQVGDGETITHGLGYGAKFVIGDLALQDREVKERKSKIDAEIENLENEFKANAAIEAYELLQKNGLLDDDED